MQSPALHISIDTWVGLAFGLGLLIPLMIAALSGGYILGGYVLDRFGRTVLGIHVRHFFTRIAPSKFFPEDHVDERIFVIETIRRAVSEGRLRLEDRLS